jgi:hypothetical protein
MQYCQCDQHRDVAVRLDSDWSLEEGLATFERQILGRTFGPVHGNAPQGADRYDMTAVDC